MKLHKELFILLRALLCRLCLCGLNDCFLTAADIFYHKFGITLLKTTLSLFNT